MNKIIALIILVIAVPIIAIDPTETKPDLIETYTIGNEVSFNLIIEVDADQSYEILFDGSDIDWRFSDFARTLVKVTDDPKTFNRVRLTVTFTSAKLNIEHVGVHLISFRIKDSSGEDDDTSEPHILKLIVKNNHQRPLFVLAGTE